jgi:hypothetical protein
MVQVVEHMGSECEALSSNCSMKKKNSCKFKTEEYRACAPLKDKEYLQRSLQCFLFLVQIYLVMLFGFSVIPRNLFSKFLAMRSE